ncbi:phenylalanine--tRNA ligase subunit beta [Desertibacillus haloalkaliphilus]|uniref:phenylalanine--tRNA ligase subunit beta n=1 Tax=Desertibacillus haloalkaliphilus TaxID=1328930 RepID=UPI001C26D797|nr:phenylalanine--tRNA ligase subunit beta [Desertibacillus haloalkaliphilus]MBU8905119.1 phenylalanine--tRNA ligase subunit beta [Desertibacillus haloalkaliphilus]
MLVSYRWLQEYIDISDLTAADIAEKLTRGGVEVDIIHSLNKGIKDVVIGHVVECGQHPNADKLNLCQVDIGEEENTQIVCGAPNVAAGQKVAVAKVGAVLPGNFKIKKAKLRGEASHGMICSLQELGIESKLVAKEFADGIFVFPNDVETGTDALEHLNINDEVLELDLTPNRADCLNMIGVAYEVAALLGREVKLPTVELSESSEQAADYISVKVEAQEDNPYYGARIVKDLKVGPSPLWMQNRLIASGIRPISNVVDITNYVLLEYGQPLHAFDYDRFGSKEVVVRHAREGEEIVTLDGETRKLSSEHLVITNGNEPTAVAGVMGGATSEVEDDTTTVLIEAAYFRGPTVRQASKDLGLRSDSSHRFEKGVDPNRVAKAADRAAQLMAELAGGTVVSGIVEADYLTLSEQKVTVTLTRINQLLGTSLSGDDVSEIFKRLQFEFTVEGETFTVYAPTRRADIEIEEDIIEEVARLYGYDHIPTTLPIGATTPGALTDYQAKRRVVRRYLETAGLSQAITYSLTTPKQAKGLAGENEGLTPVTLSMPMSEDRSTMRTSLLPHLLDVISYNRNRNVNDVSVYEVGSIFLSEEEVVTKQPTEKEMVAGAFTGVWQNHPWQQEKKLVDFFVVKGVLEGLFAKLGLESEITFTQGQKPGFHPGRTAIVEHNGSEVGVIGQVHPSLQKELDLNETYVFQLELETLLEAEVDAVFYQQLPRYPSITRDIALVVDEDVSADHVKTVIETAGQDLLKDVYLFDLYQGEHMEEGKKSLAFSLKYYDPERTLTDEEVTKVHTNVLSQLEKQAGATLRG